MKRTEQTKRALRGAYAGFLLIISAGILQGQHLVNTGTFTNNGTIKVKQNFTTSQDTFGGTVDFYGTAQSVPAIRYVNLSATGASGDKTFAGSTVVTGDISVNQTSGGFLLSATDTLDLQKTSSVPVTVASGTFDVSAGTTKYGAGSQVIYGTTYKNLLTSGGNKTASGSVTVSSGGTFTNSVTANFGSNAFTGTNATFANTGTLQSAGVVTLGSGTTVNGTFDYNSGSAQTIADATYTGTLSVSGAGAKTIGNVTIAGTYAVAGGARTYDGTFTYNSAAGQTITAETYDSLAFSGGGTKTFAAATTTTVGTALTSSDPVVVSGTLALSNNAVATLSGDLTVNGTLNANATGATVNFNGGAQTISGTATTANFTNLTLSGTADKTSSINLDVAGIFTPTQGINMGTDTLIISNTAANAVASYGHLEMVQGKMRRAIGTTAATYVMNDSATSVYFAAVAPTSFTLTVQPATPPTGYTASTHVNRKITPAYSGTFSGLTMKLGYLDAEKPSANESKLRFFKSNGNKISTGQGTVRTASSSSSWGVIAMSGIADGSSTAIDSELVAGNELIMKNTGAALITLADGGDWNTAGAWDEGYVPTTTDDVEIAHVTTLSTATAAVASTLTINASQSLNISGANLTVSGNTVNNGTLTVGASRTLQVGSSGTGTLTNAGSVVNNGTVMIGD